MTPNSRAGILWLPGRERTRERKRWAGAADMGGNGEEIGRPGCAIGTVVRHGGYEASDDEVEGWSEADDNVEV